MNVKPLSRYTSWFILYNFMNACIATAICLGNFPSSALFWSMQSVLFSTSANLGHFFALFSLASLPFWFLGKLAKLPMLKVHLVTLVNIFALILVYLDARIFELYKFHLNGMVIELILGGALQDILSFNFLVWSLFAAIAIGFLAFQIFLSKIILYFCSVYRIHQAFSLIAFVLFFVSATVSQSIYILSDAKGDTTITSLKRYIPWAQTITAKRRLRDLGIEVTETNNQELNYKSHDIYYPKAALECEPEDKYNLLIVVVDSLRFDMLTESIMPNSWKLAQNSHRYTQYFSLANSTRFGLFTLMYGLPGNYWYSMLNIQKGSVLFDVLRKQDYELFIYSAAPLYSPEFDRTIFTDVKEHINIGPQNTPAHKKDQYITTAFAKRLDEYDRKKPFFGFMFYDSPHSFSYPDSFEERFTPSWDKINYLELNNTFDPTEFFNRYKNSAAYTDQLIGETINTLRKNTLLNNTIVVFTSDHGQEFNETGENFWGHNGNFSMYQTQVPFFIHWPETHPLHGAQVYEKQTASIDVIPTLMSEALACSNPVNDYSLGLNLYAAGNDYTRPLSLESWSKRAIMGENYILVSHDAGGNEILDRNYKPQPDFSPPQKDFSYIFKQLSAFKTKVKEKVQKKQEEKINN